MILCLQKGLVYIWRWHFVLAVLDPQVGHTMDVLSTFISVLCHSDWLFHGESCPRLDVIHPSRVWSSSSACILHSLFVAVTYGKVSLLLWKSLENSGIFFNYNCGHTYVLNGGTYPPAGSNCGLSSGPLLKIRDIQCAVDVLGLIWKVAAAVAFRTHYCGNFLQGHRPTY